jgi:Spy/CpxP family protein refolding chaperone
VEHERDVGRHHGAARHGGAALPRSGRFVAAQVEIERKIKAKLKKAVYQRSVSSAHFQAQSTWVS